MQQGQKTSAEQVVLKLRQIEVQTAQGKSLALACKEAEISEQSYYRWRKEYGGLETDQVRRMKDLEVENQRLRKAIADLTLDKLILQEAPRETSSLFGVHRSISPRAHPYPVRERSCGVLASLRGRRVPPHDGIRGSGRSHLSRALGRTDARVSSVSPAPVVPAGTSSTPEELDVT
ncbi:hypothetical protein LNAOJCKE_1728 [Methylorubrum aminovorans]|uniref:Transposase n=1 Tax=Methylorubrum aminovorans TaxID=269069 RepID=A0ABQ4UDG5_9HYPH|nr:hypothetical protein LNAOJCKE_1728 [Methylorubrum aminovorans]GMA76028.1 hypothetical protein GCM10025880_24450 [Methylorubrum aminovorans]